MVVGLGGFLGRAGWRSRNTVSMPDLHMQMEQNCRVQLPFRGRSLDVSDDAGSANGRSASARNLELPCPCHILGHLFTSHHTFKFSQPLHSI
jgi:hypothetical protein